MLTKLRAFVRQYDLIRPEDRVIAAVSGGADSIALLHQGRLIFHKNKDELMQEYGILRCSEDQLRSLPKDWVVASHRGGCGWESLIHPRARVLHALPGAVCDPANIDDIMRFYCGREHQ